MASSLINVPAKARRGEIIEIKALMSHIMETGFRRTAAGELVPRNILTSFSCCYNGDEIFRADLFPAIAANPFIASPPSRCKVERSISNGSATAASAKPLPPRSRSNECAAR